MSLKIREIRNIDKEALEKKLYDLEMELFVEPKKARSLRISIARIKTHLALLKKNAKKPDEIVETKEKPKSE